jgi:hypothetical protein
MTNGQREAQLSIKNWTEEIGSIQSQKLKHPSSASSVHPAHCQNNWERHWPELGRERERERTLRGKEKRRRREGKGRQGKARGAVGRHSEGVSLTL